MKLFVHPVYGTNIPWLCRLRLHSTYPVGNFNGVHSFTTHKCSRCGWEGKR